MIMKFRYLALLGLMLPAALLCQEFRGTISGAVTDASGAAVVIRSLAAVAKVDPAVMAPSVAGELRGRTVCGAALRASALWRPSGDLA